MRKALRISLWIIGSIILLLLLVVVFLNTGPGKNFVRKQAVAFLKNKLKTEVQIGGLDYQLPKMIVLRDVLFLDQKRDTLLAGKELKVDIAMLKLLDNTVDVQEIHLSGITAHIYRNAPDTAFNFTYIVNAFVTQSATPDTSTKVLDTSAKLTMHLDRLVVDHVRFRMDDYTGGMRMDYGIDTLNLTMKELDPESMTFRINKLYADGLRAAIVSDTSYLPPDVDTSTAPLAINLSAEELNLKNVFFSQDDKLSKFFMDFKIGSLLTHPGDIDLTNQRIAIKDFTLDNAQVNVLMGAVAAQVAEQVADTALETNPAPSAKWVVKVGDVNLNNIGFVMNNQAAPKAKSGIDYAHLNISGLVLDADDINYTTDTIEGVINHLAAKEQSGLDLRELKTRFTYNPQGGYLRDLYLATDKTILQDYMEVRYPSLDALAKNMNLMQLNINLQNSIVGMKDVLLFAPQLSAQPFFKKNGNGQLRLAANVTGRMDALDLKQLYLSGLGSTEVNVRGTIYGMPDPNKLSYNLNIARLQSSRSDIETLLPPATLAQIRLPDRFGLTGTVSGTTTAYKPNLLLMSSDGNASVKGLVDMSRGTGRERYDLAVKTQALNLGRILKQEATFGSVSADLTARGTGFDPKTLNATAKGTIHAARFQKYTYHDIAFNANMARQRAEFELDANDPNARLDVKGTADLSGKYPAVVANAQLDSINFQALGFYASELRVRGNVQIDMPEVNPDYPRGTISIQNPLIVANGERYALDTFYVTANPSADSGNNINLYAQIMSAHVWGHTPLTKAGNIIQYHIDRHYVFNDSTAKSQAAVGKKYDMPADYDLNLQARVEKHPLIASFVPGLTELDTVRIDAGVTPQRLFLNADAPKIVYTGYKIDGVKVRVDGEDTALNYLASVRHFQMSTLDLYYTRVQGNLETNTVNANVSVADVDSNQRFGVGASLQRNGEEQVVQLQPGLMLNYKTWEVSQPNKIVFAPAGFYIQNFGIRNGSESIAVNSQSPTYGAPLTADIANFLLSNITEVVSKDTLLANGVLGGNVNLQSLTPSPQLTSNLQITDLSVLGDTIGNLTIDARSANQNAIDAAVGINGRGNDIKLNGQYFMQPVNGNNFDMNLVFNPLNVAAFEGATGNAIKNTTGFIRGDLRVQGTPTAPVINGELRTDNLNTTVSMLNAPFRMQNEVIRFNGQSIVMDNFNIRDSAGNMATIDGRILTNNFADMQLAMRVRANNWQAMNSTPQENKDFYGDLFLTTNMNITGSVAAPDIDGSLNILKGTNVTVAIPEAEPGIQEREGVVEFANMSSPDGPYVLASMKKDSVRKMATVPLGSNIDVDVDIAPEAEFSVIVDQGTGDFLKIKGRTNLNTSVSSDGTLGLTGTYEIVDGSYQLNYNFVRRLFRIQPGSTITFAGEPTDAELNVTAIYEANVPPYDLVSRLISDESELTYFKQRLPFEVQLKVAGQMMQPRISFDVVLPEEKNYRVSSDIVDVVQNRLSELRTNESELNKQVFALIILNRFVGDNPFENGAGGGGTEAIVRSSASRFISEQLNQFAGGLIQGLDLTVDLATSEDYTTGERRNRTDLNIGASKRLLNDRLTINVGNNFQLEGPRGGNTQNTSIIPGNIAVDYDLTADRKYRVRFFRRDQDQGGLDGFVTQTGVSFILQVEYNRFKQVFMSKKKRDMLREERRRKRQDDNKQDSLRTTAVFDDRQLKLAKRK